MMGLKLSSVVPSSAAYISDVVIEFVVFKRVVVEKNRNHDYI